MVQKIYQQIPETGFLRLRQIIGDHKSTPPISGLIPIGRSTFLSGVKSGRFPKPVKITKRLVGWRVEDIRDLIESLNQA